MSVIGADILARFDPGIPAARTRDFIAKVGFFP
jgi:hypothetical protein